MIFGFGGVACFWGPRQYIEYMYTHIYDTVSATLVEVQMMLSPVRLLN